MSADSGAASPGIIFDCDGVLSDTERYGQLPAFNQTFAEFGLPVHWSEEDYAEKLAIGGGKERLASLLDDAFVREAGLPADPDAQLAEVRRWHRRKTVIYTDLVRSGALPARPGVRRIVDDAVSEGWQLAVASTSAEESVRAVLEHAVGPETARHFEIFAGDIVERKKPAPDIYQLAVASMRRTSDDTVVVEDSRNGLLAATAAGLACVVTVNGYTAGENLDEAALVVSSLGDPGGEPTEVVADRCNAGVSGYVRLDNLLAAMPDGGRVQGRHADRPPVSGLTERL